MKDSKHLDRAAMLVATGTGVKIRHGVREGLGNAYPEIKKIEHEGQKGSGELPKGFNAQTHDRLTTGQKRAVRFGGRKAIKDNLEE